MDRLVREREHIEQSVEMADRGVNVDGLDGIAAPDVDRIETLAEANEILEVAMIAGPASSGAIERIGRRGDRTERDMAFADPDVARRVARMQREALGREADLGFHQRRIEAHAIAARRDVGARRFQQRPRLVVQDVYADFLQHRQRGVVNRFQFVGGDETDRRESEARLRRGRGGRMNPLDAATAAARRILARRFHRHGAPQPFCLSFRVSLAARLAGATREIGIATCQFARRVLIGHRGGEITWRRAGAAAPRARLRPPSPCRRKNARSARSGTARPPRC